MSNNNNYDDFINRLEEYASKPDNTVFADCDIEGMSNFHKDGKTSKVWWVERLDSVGEFLFSFDRKKISKIAISICTLFVLPAKISELDLKYMSRLGLAYSF